jgi:type II secretory pathway pseudopilin PulG
MRSRKSPTLRRGSSLTEVTLVLTIVSILASLSIPTFRRAMEQARADLAAANLQAIWSAQRLYWLEYRTYAPDLPTLQSLGLLDPTLVTSQAFYTYQIQSADANTFTATAIRTPNMVWNGIFSIDDTGVLAGVLTAPGEPNIVPGFQ